MSLWKFYHPNFHGDSDQLFPAQPPTGIRLRSAASLLIEITFTSHVDLFLQSQTMIKQSLQVNEVTTFTNSQIDSYSNVIFLFPCLLNMFHIQIDFQREYYSRGVIATSKPKEINIRNGINSRP